MIVLYPLFFVVDDHIDIVGRFFKPDPVQVIAADELVRLFHGQACLVLI